MRIRVAYNPASNVSCGSMGYGEVEDYEVNIVAAAGGASGAMAKLTEEPKVNISPNPTSGIINVEVSSELLGAELKIIGLNGAEILSQIIVNENITIDLKNSPGSNLLIIIYDKKVITNKVIVQ